MQYGKGYVVIFNHLPGVLNVALLLVPIVHNLTLVSGMRHVSELLVPVFLRPVLLAVQLAMPRARGMVAYVRDGYEAFRQSKFECDC